MNKSFIYLFLIIFTFSCKSDKNTPTNPHNFLPKNINQEVVHDLSNLFSSQEVKTLSQKIIDYENTSTNEIAILTIDSISFYKDIQKFGTDVANLWGVGKKDTNNWFINCFMQTV